MPPCSNKLSQFWQELKRRRVIHVIIVYATAAFVIIELVNNVYETLRLPEWTPALALIILAIGFPIALIFSWIFDITPEGIEKTKPSQEVSIDEKSSAPGSWRIATYVSIVVIFGLLALNIFGGRRGTIIDESLEKSLAVLPFENFSSDADQQWMCDGLTEEIIKHLYRIESFDKVITHATVLNYKNPDKNITEIAEELGVNYILTGVYKKVGDQLRVSVQLIESSSDGYIWQRDYDRPYKEIISIQSDIALQIADHLKTFIAESEHRMIEQIPTENLEAYEVLKQAGYLFKVEEANAGLKALELAKAAIKIDPEYAEAYAIAGIFTLFQGLYSGQIEIKEAAWEAIPYFDDALELDLNNATAHMGKAFVDEWARWDYIEAEKGYLKAIELEPNNPLFYLTSDEFFVKMNQLDAFWTIMDKSPKKEGSFLEMAMSYFLSGDIREAYNAIIPSKSEKQNYRWIGECYIWLEEFDSVKFYLEYAMENDHPDMLSPRFQTYLVLAYNKTNNPQKAQKLINQLVAKNDTTSVGSPAYFLGWYYSWIQEPDSAYYWLEQAHQNHSPEFSWFKVDPAFNSLKEDPRYWDLYERTGHKAYDDYIARK